MEELDEKLKHMDSRPAFNTGNSPLLDIALWYRPSIILWPDKKYEVHCDGYKPDLGHVIHGNPRLVEYGHTGEHARREKISVFEAGSYKN